MTTLYTLEIYYYDGLNHFYAFTFAYNWKNENIMDQKEKKNIKEFNNFPSYTVY